MKRSYGPGAAYVKRQRTTAPMEYAAVVDVPRAIPSYAKRGYFTSRTGYRAYRKRYSNVRYGGYLGQEKKYLDTERQIAIANGYDWTGAEADPTTVNCLNAVAQGDGVTQRDGNKYCITEIQIKGTIQVNPQANQTTLDAPPLVFLALVQDKQTNAAQLNSEDVYTNPSSGSLAGQANPFRNIQYSKRFKVLRSERIEFPPLPVSYDGTNMEVGGLQRSFEWYIKLKKPIYVECKGTSANVTDIVDNSLHMLAVVDQASTSTAPIMTYNSRIRFYG